MPDQTPAQYSYISWVRRGLASLISGTPTVNYASLPVTLALNGTPINAPPIRLPGPGDVTGLDPQAVLRTEPRNGANSFEPNYLATVDLATLDLPWLVTPAAPVSGRLRPWICLVVIPETDGASIQPQRGGPDILRIDAPLVPLNELPDLSQSDVWAHAQVIGEGLSGPALQAALQDGSATGISRLICPRRLEAGRVYNACIVPTFRAGMNAGLGIAVDDHDLSPAWDQTVTAPFALPVYYRFRFSTGADGDFVSLARKITPANLPADVGGRPMDASQPGFGATAVPGATLILEGALRIQGSSPAAWPAGTQLPYQATLQKALVPPPAPNPVVSPPVYGAAQTGAALPAAGAPPVWLGDLNLDPRTRAAAAAGGQVIQNNQDALLASAWDQAGDIRKANQLLRQAQLARQVSLSLGTRHLDTIAGAGQYLQVTAPVHGRVLTATGSARATLRGQMENSILPVRAVSAQMRKLARPGGPIGRRLQSPGLPPQIVDRLNLSATDAKAITAAGPLKPPAGMVTLDAVAPATPGTTVPIQVAKLATKVQGPGWRTTTTTTQPASTTGTTLSSAETSAAATTRTETATTETKAAETSTTESTGAKDTTVSPPIIDWSKDPDVPAILTTASPNLPPPMTFPSDAASLAAMQTAFESAAGVTNGYLTTTVAVPPPPPPLGGGPVLDGTRLQLRARLNPEVTIVARMGVRIPLGTGADPLQPLTPGIQFPQAMYSFLADISPEWMLPGISKAPADSAALLETNPRFVEAFMIGLNEEMSREFVWRELPTDPRATFFQSFWAGGSQDIPAIASFDGTLPLGGHTSDAATGGTLVLLVRAELFSRYPNAVVSAAPAVWNPDGTRGLGGDRQFPVFRGDIDPDFTFFGFKIADPVGLDDPAANKPGWYFLLEEHATEPRFGLESGTPAGASWNDLRWEDFTTPVSFLNSLTAPQSPSREGVAWTSDGAAMAFILLRRPVRVALHGRALLTQGGA